MVQNLVVILENATKLVLAYLNISCVDLHPVSVRPQAVWTGAAIGCRLVTCTRVCVPPGDLGGRPGRPHRHDGWQWEPAAAAAGRGSVSPWWRSPRRPGAGPSRDCGGLAAISVSSCCLSSTRPEEQRYHQTPIGTNDKLLKWTYAINLHPAGGSFWPPGHSTTNQSRPDTLISQIFMKIFRGVLLGSEGDWYNFRSLRAKLLELLWKNIFFGFHVVGVNLAGSNS